MKKLLLLVVSIVGPVSLSGLPSAAAQEPTDNSDIAQQFASLRAESLEIEATNPAVAIAQYQVFYKATGWQDAQVSAAISSLVAQLYVYGLHDKGSAEKMYEWAVARYGQQPGGERSTGSGTR